MDIRQAVGQRVKSLREGADLTQQVLAERTGLSDETISRMERGTQGITVDNLALIADVLGVGFADLCDIESSNDELASSSAIQEIVRTLKSLSPESVTMARDLVAVVAAHRDEQ